MHPTVEAARNSIYLATSDEVKGITGKFFDNKKTKEVAANAKDVQLQKGLWELSEKLTGTVWCVFAIQESYPMVEISLLV